jgi:hypothetical protein
MPGIIAPATAATLSPVVALVPSILTASFPLVSVVTITTASLASVYAAALFHPPFMKFSADHRTLPRNHTNPD